MKYIRVQFSDSSNGNMSRYVPAVNYIHCHVTSLMNIHDGALQGVLDYERASVYQLVVVARDRGHDPLSAESIVVVRLEDVNDNAPLITIRTLTSDVIEHLTHSPIAQVCPMQNFTAKQSYH